MKKLFGVLLAVLSMVALLCACTSTKNPPDGDGGTNPPEPGPGPEVSKIVDISVADYKDTFHVGEEFSAGDLTVTAYYEDGTEKVITDEQYSVDSTAFNAEKAGEYAITVKAGEATDSYKVLVRSSLKILSIGNSFSEDAHQYLCKIIKSIGHYDEVITGSLTIGGCELQRHYNNAKNNTAAYAYRKEVYRKGSNSEVTSSPTKRTIMSALVEEDWDYVTLQQVSQDSGRPETIPYNQLEALSEYVRAPINNKYLKVAWHSTWAYQANSGHGGFANYDRHQMTMYHAIMDVAQEVIIPSGQFELIIPTGTAVQNARTSYVGDTLTRDGFHMSYDRGRFLVALAFYKGLTGDSIEAIAQADILSIVGTEAYAKQVNATFVDMAIESVNNAYKTPFEVTKSTY